MGGSSNEVAVRKRVRMELGSYQSGDMGDVCQKISTYLIRNFSEFFEVNEPRIGARSTDDEFWFTIPGNL